MRILLTLQYLGTRYAGWQSQTNATGIQNVIEGALATMFNTPVRIEGAGRTDAGVHARAQRAHADVPFAIEPRGFRQGINNLLPHDIRVAAVETVADDFHYRFAAKSKSYLYRIWNAEVADVFADETHAFVPHDIRVAAVETVADDFHCRFAAKSKSYLYRIWNAEVADVFADETHAFVPQPLDDVRMRDAAQALMGLHDFAPFTVISPEVSSTERRITSIDVVRDGSAITIPVAADGFLRYMVRRIAGSLIEIGRGKLAPDAIWDVARWTAPAKGLTLWSVEY